MSSLANVGQQPHWISQMLFISTCAFSGQKPHKSTFAFTVATFHFRSGVNEDSSQLWLQFGVPAGIVSPGKPQVTNILFPAFPQVSPMTTGTLLFNLPLPTHLSQSGLLQIILATTIVSYHLMENLHQLTVFIQV